MDKLKTVPAPEVTRTDFLLAATYAKERNNWDNSMNDNGVKQKLLKSLSYIEQYITYQEDKGSL